MDMKVTGKSIESELKQLAGAISDLRATIGRTEEAIYQPTPCTNSECGIAPAITVVADRITDCTQDVLNLNARMCAIESTVVDQLQGLRLK